MKHPYVRLIRTCTAVSAALIQLTSMAQTPPASRTPQIPLREGLTIVRALRKTNGDYESVTRVVRVDTSTVKLTFSTDQPPSGQDNDPIAAMLGGGCHADPGERDSQKRHWTAVRAVRREDLEAAHSYWQAFKTCGSGEDLHPGSTAVSVSSSVLRELNVQGQTRLRVMVLESPAAAFGSLMGALGGASKEMDEAAMDSGVLARAEKGAVPFKALVNGEPAELPAVHARGRFGDHVIEFWILNDTANPLVLRVSAGDNQFLQVIKLSYPLNPAATSAPAVPPPGATAASATATNIERDLAKEGRAVVYGIYFDFGSDRIKEESDAVLAEIAKVLQKNPSWSLAVEGHTDNVGGDAYNLDLSKRRAAAVKQALMSRYKVDGKRLQTFGYGASRPKDSNETLEGRARNRRVELVRL